MPTDGRESDSAGGSERLVHDLMTALAIAKGNTQLLQRRLARARGPRSAGTTDGLADARLGEGLARIDAALAVAVAAGRALIDHARATEAMASPRQPGSDRIPHESRPDPSPRERTCETAAPCSDRPRPPSELGRPD